MTLTNGSTPTLATGDLVFFSGKGLSSTIVKGFTCNRWSHIGMVVVWPGHEEPLIIEATRGNETADVFSGERHSGVTLVPLSSKLAAYRGDIAYRRRQGEAMSQNQSKRLLKLCQALWRRPYRDYVTCHALMTLRGYPKNAGYRGLFCSELVAELYRRMGWLSSERPSHHYVPASFVSTTLALQHGALTPLVTIKTSDVPSTDIQPTVQQTVVREMPLQQQLHAVG